MLFLKFGGSFALNCSFFHLSVFLISYLMTKLPAPTNIMLNEDMNLSRTYKMMHSLDVTMSEFFSLPWKCINMCL